MIFYHISDKILPQLKEYGYPPSNASVSFFSFKKAVKMYYAALFFSQQCYVMTLGLAQYAGFT